MSNGRYVLKVANTETYVFSAENGSMTTTHDWGYAKRFGSYKEYCDFIYAHCPQGYAFEPVDVGYRMDKYAVVENYLAEVPDLADLDSRIVFTPPALSVPAKIRIDYSYTLYEEMQNVWYAAYVGTVGLGDGESPITIFVPMDFR